MFKNTLINVQIVFVLGSLQNINRNLMNKFIIKMKIEMFSLDFLILYRVLYHFIFVYVYFSRRRMKWMCIAFMYE